MYSAQINQAKVIDTKDIRKLMVSGDECDTIRFIVDKVANSVDRTAATWAVRFLTSGNVGDEELLTPVVQGDYLYLDWTPKDWATSQSGVLDIQVYALLGSTYKWHSKPAQVMVERTIDVTNPGGYTHAILEEYVVLIASYTLQAENARDAAIQAQGSAESACDAILQNAGFIIVASDLVGDDTIGTVAANIAPVVAVANDMPSVVGVHANKTNINGVHANKTNIDGVNANKTNIDKAANNEANINAAVANELKINTVADDLALGVEGLIKKVSDNKTNIDKVAAIDTNVTTVAGIQASVTSLAAIVADITSLNAIKADVTSLNAVKAAVSALALLTTQLTALGAKTTELTALGARTAEIDALYAELAQIATKLNASALVTTFTTPLATTVPSTLLVDTRFGVVETSLSDEQLRSVTADTEHDTAIQAVQQRADALSAQVSSGLTTNYADHVQGYGEGTLVAVAKNGDAKDIVTSGMSVTNKALVAWATALDGWTSDYDSIVSSRYRLTHSADATGERSIADKLDVTKYYFMALMGNAASDTAGGKFEVLAGTGGAVKKTSTTLAATGLLRLGLILQPSDLTGTTPHLLLTHKGSGYTSFYEFFIVEITATEYGQGLAPMMLKYAYQTASADSLPRRWEFVGRNLHDKSLVVRDSYYGSTGNLIASVGAFRGTAYIPVAQSTAYTISAALLVNEYDKDKTNIQRIAVANFTTSPNTRFIRISSTTVDLTGNIILNLGSTALTYEPFTKSIYDTPFLRSIKTVSDTHASNPSLGLDVHTQNISTPVSVASGVAVNVTNYPLAKTGGNWRNVTATGENYGVIGTDSTTAIGTLTYELATPVITYSPLQTARSYGGGSVTSRPCWHGVYQSVGATVTLPYAVSLTGIKIYEYPEGVETLVPSADLSLDGTGKIITITGAETGMVFDVSEADITAESTYPKIQYKVATQNVESRLASLESPSTTNTVVGHENIIDVANGATTVLPAGGTFRWEVLTYGSTISAAKIGLANGGATLTATGNLSVKIRRLT